MASSTMNWKPVSRRVIDLPGGAIMRRHFTGRTTHKYTLKSPNGEVVDFSLHSGLSPKNPVIPRPHHSKVLELIVTKPNQHQIWGSKDDFFSMGSGVVRAAARSIKKMYPNLRWIYGTRAHKSGAGTKRIYPVTVLPMSRVK